MGYYFRKSVRVGPVRFNLSKGGLGVSVGVRGLRYGVRPDGKAYVHGGRYGLYFREQVGQGRREAAVQESKNRTDAPLATAPTTVYSTAEASRFSEIAGGDVAEFLRRSYGWPRLDYGMGIVAVLLSAGGFFLNVVLGIATAALSLLATLWACRWECRRRTVYANYDLQGEGFRAYQDLVTSFNHIASCHCVWLLDTSTRLMTLQQYKAHAGASELVERRFAKVGSGIPPWMETNLDVPTILARNQTLYFLPEGLLVYDATGIGQVAYRDLRISVDSTRFIESSPPSDASIVGHTWLHPNKDGGPDRRYSTNHQMPVCLYGEIALQSASGMLLLFQTSNNAVPAKFQSAFCALMPHITCDNGAGTRPNIEVNAEHFQSLPAYIWSSIGSLGQGVIAAAKSADGVLQKVAGDGNTILHTFLRVLSVAFAVLALSAASYFVVHWLAR